MIKRNLSLKKKSSFCRSRFYIYKRKQEEICSDVESFSPKISSHEKPDFRSSFLVSCTWFRFDYNVMAQNANCKLRCCQNSVHKGHRNIHTDKIFLCKIIFEEYLINYKSLFQIFKFEFLSFIYLFSTVLSSILSAIQF